MTSEVDGSRKGKIHGSRKAVCDFRANLPHAFLNT
jgi:hypothetical protein